MAGDGAEAEAEFEKMVQYQMEKMGEGGTREAAIEEVVANTVPVILTDEEQGKRFAEEVMHSTSKVKAWFEQLLKDLREILDKAYNILKDEKSWKQMEIVRNKATIDTIADIYFEGMKGIEQAEAQEISDADLKFSVREEEPPKNTIKAYKVFVAFKKYPGELFPPMVANPGGKSTPVGIWLNADVGKMAADSKTGRKQVEAGGKGTQATRGKLAFRPGWHLGDLPYAKQFARKNPETGVKELFPANFIWAECECAADLDYQEEAMKTGYTKSGKFRHSYAGLQRLPRETDGTAGYYRYRTNPDPTTVPWIITGAMKVTRILDDAEVRSILEKNGVTPMQRKGGDIDLAQFGLKAGDVEQESNQSEDAKHSLKDIAQPFRFSSKDRESKTIKEQIREHANELNMMEVVAEYSVERIAGMDRGPAKREAYKVFGDNYRIDKQGYGTVVFGENQIDNGINHLDIKKHPEEVAAIFAVPSVIRHGIEVGRDNNHDGVKQKTVTFAAPVTMRWHGEEERVNIGVAVIEERKNYYHAHRVLMPDGSVIQLNNKKTETKVAVTPAAKADAVAPVISANGSISSDIGNVKASSKDPDVHFLKKDTEQHAVSEFGTTYSWSETGYITPSGKQLDFSGKKDGGSSGRRSMDHREVESLYEADGISGSDAMVKFMGEGNIRISPEIGGINLQSLPTKAQFDKLQAFVRKNNGEVTIDFDDADGNTLHSIDYPKGTGPVRVNNDIRRFYEEGTVPALSDTLRYRFSQKDTREEAQREVTAQYKQRAHEILNGVERKGVSLLVGYTPDIYRKLGMPGLPFVVGSGHVYSMAKTKAEAQAEGLFRKGTNYHGMGETVVENILDYVEDPIMVIAAKDVNASATPLRSTHSVVALVNVGKGKDSMVIPIAITAERTVAGVRMDVNAISSAYEKNVTSLVNEAIAQFNAGETSIFYIKREAADLIGAGVQFPARLKTVASSDGIVAKLGSKINMLVQNATESQQFKRWFGDWQNNPAKASKAVNKKGVPLLLYHYTDKKFTVFDISRSGSNQGSRLGDGTYLSSSETEFAGYGKYKMVLYANIRNPFEMQLTEKQAKYVLEKYGATKHDLDSHDGLYREHAMSKLTNPIRVMDYLKEYAKDNGIRTSDILKDLKYDGIHDGTEWVVFDPTQIKSATDNIGTFDGTNPDIRFSRKDGVSVTAEDARKLQKENEKLKQALEVAKQEIKLSDGHHTRIIKPRRLSESAGLVDLCFRAYFPSVSPFTASIRSTVFSLVTNAVGTPSTLAMQFVPS